MNDKVLDKILEELKGIKKGIREIERGSNPIQRDVVITLDGQSIAITLLKNHD